MTNTVETHLHNIDKTASPPWYLGPYFLLTVMLVLSAIVYPLVTAAFGDQVVKLVYTGLLVTGLYAVRSIQWLFRTLAVLILPILAANWLVDTSEPHQVLDALTTVATELFLLAVMIAVFVDVVKSRHVDADAIFGSIAVYLLFGVLTAMTFQVIDNLTPGVVIAGIEETSILAGGQLYNYLYFSFMTLTSVGYGDFAPVSAAARSVAMFEGIVGQLYIAILVARLVGIHIAQE